MVEVLGRMGGVATRASLIAATSRAEVDAARQADEVVVVARGRYALPSADAALVAAHRLSGVVSHTSAALHHGWQVRLPPDLPHVTLPKGRTLTTEQQLGIPDEVALILLAAVAERTERRCECGRAA